jgi:lactate permease
MGGNSRVGDIFLRVLFWSVVMTLVTCLIVYLQSTAVLDGMVLEAK